MMKFHTGYVKVIMASLFLFQFDGHPVERKCFPAIRHEDGEIIHVKDSVLVCSGRKEKDIPYVAKVTNFWEDPMSSEFLPCHLGIDFCQFLTLPRTSP